MPNPATDVDITGLPGIAPGPSYGSGDTNPDATQNTQASGGNTGGGNVDWESFYNQLANDPMYKQAMSFIDASRAIDKSQLQGNEGRATEKYNETLRRIGINREDALRNVMNDLAARHAVESGDTSFYRGKVEEQANQQKFDAQMSMKDYMAGVEAAYQAAEFNRMMSQYNAMQNAANFEIGIWQTMGGFPGATSGPPGPGSGPAATPPGGIAQ